MQEKIEEKTIDRDKYLSSLVNLYRQGFIENVEFVKSQIAKFAPDSQTKYLNILNSYPTNMAEVMHGDTCAQVQEKWEAGELTLDDYLRQMAKAMIRRGDTVNEVELWVQHFLTEHTKTNAEV
jgi:hypothetical protein